MRCKNLYQERMLVLAVNRIECHLLSWRAIISAGGRSTVIIYFSFELRSSKVLPLMTLTPQSGNILSLLVAITIYSLLWGSLFLKRIIVSSFYYGAGIKFYFDGNKYLKTTPNIHFFRLWMNYIKQDRVSGLVSDDEVTEHALLLSIIRGNWNMGMCNFC